MGMGSDPGEIDTKISVGSNKTGPGEACQSLRTSRSRAEPTGCGSARKWNSVPAGWGAAPLLSSRSAGAGETSLAPGGGSPSAIRARSRIPANRKKLRCSGGSKRRDAPHTSTAKSSGCIAPSATLFTVPVIIIEKPSPISIPIFPPGMWTVTSRSIRPRRRATAAAALELLPEARATMMAGFYATSGVGRMIGVLLGGWLWQKGGITAVAWTSAGFTVLGLLSLVWGLHGWRRQTADTPVSP